MKDKLRNILFEIAHKDVPLAEITDIANLADDLGFDSLMFVTLVSTLESKLKITIHPQEINLENFKNIETISELLEKKYIEKKDGDV